MTNSSQNFELNGIFPDEDGDYFYGLADTLEENQTPRIPLLPGDLAVKLYQELKETPHAGNNDQSESNLFNSSVTSSSLSKPTCRICRYARGSQEVLFSPCMCTGSVGNIHLNCLRRWVRFTGNRECELCRAEYDPKVLARDYFQLCMSFFSRKCLGAIAKNVVYLTSVTPLVFLSLRQAKVLEKLELTESPSSLSRMFAVPLTLLAISLYFFFYFDWTLSCIFRIKRIIHHWWNFGDQYDEDEDEVISISSAILDAEMFFN